MGMIRTIMSALSATMFIRRCVGSASAAFISNPHWTPNTHLSHRGLKQVSSYDSARTFTSSMKMKHMRPAFAKMHMSTTTQTDTSSLVGIDWVRSSVLATLNQIFDPVEIAKGAAIAKLDGKKKKKKKPEEQEEEPTMSPGEREAIINAAAKDAKPFSLMDAMVTPATKPEFGDYQCNAAMSLAKSAGLNPRDCAAKIVEGLKSIEGFEHIMEEPEIAGPGFINLKFRDGYLAEAARKMALDSGEAGRLAVPGTS
jgi:hypothetical protein